MDEISITEVCRRTGLSSRTLRFWEARGLLGARRTAAGQRRYGPTELARLHQVATLKRAGFTLAQVGDLLGRRPPDLVALIDAQLDVLDVERDRIDEAAAALRAAKSRLATGRALDIDTFCTLIRQGETAMSEQAQWKKVIDRYYTPEEQEKWTATKLAALPADFEQDGYQRQWTELTDRIEAALPLDPASPAAQGFVAEWQALLAPFAQVADTAMWEGATKLYDRIDEWSGDVKPPFSSAVWAFVKQASAAGKQPA